MTVVAMKVCKACKRELPETFFALDSSHSTGRRSKCKECVNEWNRTKYNYQARAVTDKAYVSRGELTVNQLLKLGYRYYCHACYHYLKDNVAVCPECGSEKIADMEIGVICTKCNECGIFDR